MIDAETLKALGWSDELVEAATAVSRQVDAAAVRSVVVNAVDVSGETMSSQRADVSGPPVAKPELRIEST